jgi:hypothetical protein
MRRKKDGVGAEAPRDADLRTLYDREKTFIYCSCAQCYIAVDYPNPNTVFPVWQQACVVIGEFSIHHQQQITPSADNGGTPIY